MIGRRRVRTLSTAIILRMTLVPYRAVDDESKGNQGKEQHDVTAIAFVQVLVFYLALETISVRTRASPSRSSAGVARRASGGSVTFLVLVNTAVLSII